MKSLIVYFSYDGNTRLVAEAMASVLDADIVELKLADQKRRKGLMKMLWGGWQVFSKAEPDLLPFDADPDAYDLLLFGTPVWGGTYAPAFRTFLSNVRVTGKAIALFCCHGGGKGKIFDKMRAALAGNDVVSQIDFVEPLKKGRERNENAAREWAEQLLGQDTSSGA